MTFTESLTNYLHPIYGVPSLYPPHPSNPLGQSIDNHHLVASHALTLMERLGEDTEKLSEDYFKFYQACCTEPGRMRRFPTSFGDISWDEVMGAARIGWQCGHFEIARDLYEWGRTHSWFYDIQEPERRKLMYFFPRNICFIPFMRACLRMRVNPLQQAAWVTGALLSLIGKKGETSGRLLIDQQILPMWETGWTAKVGTQVWLYFMKRQYPKGRAEIYGIYFKTHPLATMQRNEWSLR
jgi:hypothetical protein